MSASGERTCQIDPELAQRLAAKQASFAIIAPKTLNEQGIVSLALKKKDLSHVDAAFFAGLQRDETMPASGIRDVLTVPPQDFWNGENPAMMSARYLAYLWMRRRKGCSQQVLQQARQIRQGLFLTHELGRQVVPGFPAKIYGMKPSRETSLDEMFGHGCALFLLGQIFPGARDELGKRAADICDWMLDNDLEYHCPSRGDTNAMQKIISWQTGSNTTLYKTSVLLALAARWAGRRDIEHLLYAALLRQKAILEQEADDPVWPAALDAMPENMYHWPYGAWVHRQLGILQGQLDWQKAIRATGQFLWREIRTGRCDADTVSPAMALGIHTRSRGWQ